MLLLWLTSIKLSTISCVQLQKKKRLSPSNNKKLTYIPQDRFETTSGMLARREACISQEVPVEEGGDEFDTASAAYLSFFLRKNYKNQLN